MRRVLVVGTSGAGKTTLAARIAARLGLPFHASDPFYWKPGWQPATAECVARHLADVMRSPEWVLDGNFERQWHDVWSRADCVVWLDYSLARVLWQVTARNLGWVLRREAVWSGNRMTVGRACSGILHAFQSHAGKRRRYVEYAAKLNGVTVHRFASLRETDAWLSSLPHPSPRGGSAAA